MAESIRELPLFPLPDVVLFPGAALPLHIFEYRYRLMINEVLDSDRMFGVLNNDSSFGKVAAIGCSAEIVEVERMPDGRMNIMTLGRDRFRVLKVMKKTPYLIAQVEFIEDDETQGDLQPLTDEMQELLRDVVRLSAKVTDKSVEFPDDLPTQAQPLSFWVANSLPGLPAVQQALLELQDTRQRLEKEAEILDSARKQLAARAALKDAFDE